ncbi:right-handed parallel beta-helix repeat-containing protein [Kitasatospora sp. NPDC002227]|uniref:right-handed parallel beta-helix repeat-containing protein n=1 Tax=Kitasatospora sp. NPDC002227 TaxID=3154773 RepID=UPI00332AC45D
MGGIIKTRTGALGAAVLLGAIALPAVGPLGAGAAPANLYVNNGSGAHCSDSGSGLQEQPFCTVSAAAKVVLPGQIVHIAKGTYPEQVNITRSGTAQAPITFRTDLGSWERPTDAGATIGSSDPGGTNYALNITGAQHVRFTNLNLAALGEAAHIENSVDVSLVSGTIHGAPQAAFRVTGKSDRVTVAKFDLWYSQGGILVDGGSTNTVLTTNQVGGGTPTITVTDAPGTVVVANSIYDGCRTGLALTGASSGATIENNVLSGSINAGPDSGCPSGTPRVKVDATSATGTKSDYNVVNTLYGGTAYDWAGTPYDDLAAFRTGAKQGANDSFGDPGINWQGDRHAAPLPAVDSADENAPGMLPTDLWGNSSKDDPLTPNTGTGSGIRDRGATELQDVGSLYTPTGPTRILDTRSAVGVSTTTPLSAWLDLQVTGRNGIPAGITAVTLNVTVTAPASYGYLQVYPTGTGSSGSNLNWSAGETIANAVTVPVSPDGKVTFWHHGNGGVHVIADIAGYYGPSGSVYHAMNPNRILDTRNGTGGTAGAVRAGGTVDLKVAGTKGVPATGVEAAVLNVTVTAPTNSGYLSVYPHGQTRPTVSSLNWTPGRTIANLVTVPVAADGSVTLYAGGTPGTVQVVADVEGYYDANGHDIFRTVNPERLMDTRQVTYDFCGGQPRKAAQIPAGGTLDLSFCYGGISSATLNVTVTNPGSGGFLTVYPHGQDRPLASNLNWSAGETIPNQVIAQVKDGKVSFYNGGWAPIDLVVDMFGYQGL